MPEDADRLVDAADRFVRLRVTDDGHGMDEATRQMIFEPFFTTKEPGKGTGLGLATVFGIVKQHGGWVNAESEVDRGSSFNVYLPHAETEEDVGEPETAPTEVARTLSRNGYQVLAADDGPEARELWTANGPDIDLLFTDIVMPKGVSGWDLADELRALRPDLRVIYTTGYSDSFENRGADLDEGVNFIHKPFTQRKLLEIVGQALNPNHDD